jgi:hypothetical protein
MIVTSRGAQVCMADVQVQLELSLVLVPFEAVTGVRTDRQTRVDRSARSGTWSATHRIHTHINIQSPTEESDDDILVVFPAPGRKHTPQRKHPKKRMRWDKQLATQALSWSAPTV